MESGGGTRFEMHSQKPSMARPSTSSPHKWIATEALPRVTTVLQSDDGYGTATNFSHLQIVQNESGSQPGDKVSIIGGSPNVASALNWTGRKWRSSPGPGPQGHHEKDISQTQRTDSLPNTRPVLPGTAKVVQDKGSLRNGPSPGEPEETGRQANGSPWTTAGNRKRDEGEPNEVQVEQAV